MASGNEPPSGDQRRRRPPTVIDVAATEVESGPATATPGQEGNEKQAGSATAEPPPRERPSAVGRGLLLAGSAVAGAVGALAVFGLLWLNGSLSQPQPPTDLGPKLAALEKQMQVLAGRPVPAPPDTKPLDELSARVSKIESAQSAPRPAPAADPALLNRLGAAEQSTKSLADQIASLGRRGDAIEAALRGAQSRLEQISASIAQLSAAERAAATGSDRAARLALAVSSLRTAVEHGDPFMAELAAVKPFTSNASAVAALEPFAANGVPSDAALAKELTALLAPLQREASTPRREGGFLERLQANAEHLVRVRPVGDAPGDSRPAILARLAQRAADGNVAGARAELAKLSPEERAPFAPWIAKVDARDQAIAASRQLAADAIAALKAAP